MSSWAQHSTVATTPLPPSLQQQHSNKFGVPPANNNMPNVMRAQQQQQPQQQQQFEQQPLPAAGNQQQNWSQQNKMVQSANVNNSWPQQSQQQHNANANTLNAYPAAVAWPADTQQRQLQLQQHQPYQPVTTTAEGTYTNFFTPAANAATTSQPATSSHIYQQAASVQQTSTQDGWGEWDDWQESNNTNVTTSTLQTNFNNDNVIEDSFNTHNNDNWSWDITATDANANAAPAVNEHNSSNGAAPVPTRAPITAAVNAQQPQPATAPMQPPVPLQFGVAAKPTTLALPLESSNDNYNSLPANAQLAAAASAALSHSSVYVSQAKPVARPSRQYASPPGGQTPDESPESMLTMAAAPPLPPQAFQNDATAAPNPFKRAGAAQHHRANIMPTTTAATTAAGINNFIGMPPPPPPADFANPILNIEPDNSEILHENQEILAPAIAQPPPNDERNQYLQTSHLSAENADDELNLDADNLPPPGLSRLVLGQPELELTSTQRLVTGTEEPAVISNNMHIEERHADGEDNSLEQQILQMPAMSGVTSASSASSSTATSNININVINTDRNLYLVPGESHAANEQRVVTGLDTALESSNASNQIINEQRDITLDGENLEDQQQAAAAAATAAARNEPPLEGASATADAAVMPLQPTLQANAEHVVTHAVATKSTTSKDYDEHSTGNNESDALPDKVHTNSSGRYAGKTQRHKQHEHERVERKIDSQPHQQRKQKSRAMDTRVETEESEELYSSDRERERDRRRGNNDYREGSVRSERDEREQRGNEKSRRREKRLNEADKTHGKYYQRGAADAHKGERRSQRYNRYADDSPEEYAARGKEHTRRQEERGGGGGGGRSDRSDRDYDYDNYNHRYRGSKREKPNVSELERERRERYAEDDRRGVVGGERRQRRGERDIKRDEYDTLERRRRPNNDKHRATDQRDYEEYRKQTLRNARESDLEKERAAGMRGNVGIDPRYDPRQMYGYPAVGYRYDPYNYYYEQMARTNPQAYAECYKKYYEQAAAVAAGLTGAAMSAASGEHLTSSSLAANDGRESVHSGRSSAQNERERAGNLSLHDAHESSHVPDPQRLTPYKYVNEHTVVSLSPGLIVSAKPKYTSHGNISTSVKIHTLGANDGTRQLYQAFPGPLVRGLTHKKTIIEFCEEQIRLGPVHTTIYAKQLLPIDVEKYSASYTLMWKLLILLLRQNGMVVGTDIAELLLKNQQQFPYVTLQQQSSTESLAKSHSDSIEQTAAAVEAAEDAVNGQGNVAAAAVTSTPLTEAEITDRFRNYLLYGNVNEALDWATDNNLWGHALFLASKLDRRSHANVMMKFANKLSLNDPLQTLYQLMSGRTPSAVTSVQDEKWGDWRPHLSMILSNTSQKPELDRKAITTLGDSLFNRGDLFAAHFCYLMSQVGFGRYQHEAVQENSLQPHLPKLVLLGSSHYKQFNEFATDDAIIMTEIYEYACSLNDDKFSIVEFQPYKYLLATRLLDYGFHLRSLMYLEQIALHVQRDPSKYEPTFIQKIYEFADLLKYYDPVLDKSIDEQQQPESAVDADGGSIATGVNNVPAFEEQKWLQSLRLLAEHQMFDHAANNNGFIDNSIAATAVASDDYQTQNQALIDQQFMDLNKQINELNLQYSDMNAAATAAAVAPTFYNAETMQVEQQAAAATLSSLDGSQLQQQQQPANLHEPQYAYADSYQQQQQPMDAYVADTTAGAYDYWQQQQQQQPVYGDEHASTMAAAAAAAARPQISMPKSKAYDSDEDHRQAKQVNTQQQQEQQQQQQAKANSNKDAANKSSQQNSGWFGGIWNKLSLKPKNQMILPDDKNPSIVWDAAKKRWVNTDGDEAAEENVKPPPKMSDIVQQAYGEQQQLQQQQQQMPYVDMQQQPPATHLPQQQQPFSHTTAAAPISMPTAALQVATANAVATNLTATITPATTTADITPKLQSNMFKMQRNRTLKNSYVDVFNPSRAPMSTAAESVLAPTLPPAAVPQGGFFIPGAVASADQQQQPQQQQQQIQPQQDMQPQFYNPNQYGATAGSY